MSFKGETPPFPTTLVGVVSDTHGLFRPELESALRGVDAILHAGDVGSRTVLDQLHRIAPVHAVMGNVDSVVPNLNLPVFERFTARDTHVLVTHYIGDPEHLLAPVEGELARHPAQVIVSGHSHRPALRVHGGRLFVNPGSAGARRFGLPASCALLTLARQGPASRVAAQIVNLESGGVIVKKSLTLADG